MREREMIERRFLQVAMEIVGGEERKSRKRSQLEAFCNVWRMYANKKFLRLRQIDRQASRPGAGSVATGPRALFLYFTCIFTQASSWDLSIQTVFFLCDDHVSCMRWHNLYSPTEFLQKNFCMILSMRESISLLSYSCYAIQIMYIMNRRVREIERFEVGMGRWNRDVVTFLSPHCSWSDPPHLSFLVHWFECVCVCVLLFLLPA